MKSILEDLITTFKREHKPSKKAFLLLFPILIFSIIGFVSIKEAPGKLTAKLKKLF